MKSNKIFLACKSLGITFVRQCCNVVRPHSTTETDLHWRIKCALFREFYKRGNTVFTEFPIGNAVTDLFVLDEKWDIEIESNPCWAYDDLENSSQVKKEKCLGKFRKNIGVWIVPVSDFKDDFDAGLKKWCEKFFSD